MQIRPWEHSCAIRPQQAKGHKTGLGSQTVLSLLRWFACLSPVILGLNFNGLCAEPSDPILDLLLQKGIVTEAEVQKARAEAERIRTNLMTMPPLESKWKISNAIKNIELFGDLRLRYEHREATTPGNDRLELDRGRYAVRLGLRGEAFD